MNFGILEERHRNVSGFHCNHLHSQISRVATLKGGCVQGFMHFKEGFRSAVRGRCYLTTTSKVIGMKLRLEAREYHSRQNIRQNIYEKINLIIQHLGDLLNIVLLFVFQNNLTFREYIL